MDHLRDVILDGGNGMPAWRGILSAAEFEQVVAFLAASQQRSPAP
jgi:mono/diheme cytochrome c family protein